MTLSKTTELTFTEVDLIDPCPIIPEGATNYEAQEIRRCYRNVLSYNKRIAERAHTYFVETTLGRLVEPRFDQDVMDATRAMTELRTRIDGVMHRLAMDERRGGA